MLTNLDDTHFFVTMHGESVNLFVQVWQLIIVVDPSKEILIIYALSATKSPSMSRILIQILEDTNMVT